MTRRCCGWLMLAVGILALAGCARRRYEELGEYTAPQTVMTRSEALAAAAALLTGLPEGVGSGLKVTADGVSGTVKRSKVSRAQTVNIQWSQVQNVYIGRHKRSGLMMVDFRPASGSARERLLRLGMASEVDAVKLADAALTLAKKEEK